MAMKFIETEPNCDCTDQDRWEDETSERQADDVRSALSRFECLNPYV